MRKQAEIQPGTYWAIPYYRLEDAHPADMRRRLVFDEPTPATKIYGVYGKVRWASFTIPDRGPTAFFWRLIKIRKRNVCYCERLSFPHKRVRACTIFETSTGVL